MNILAIDTALDACSVAIVGDGQTLVSCVEPMARGQAERLAPMVRETMLEAALAMESLDRIAVTRGPGAFTGLRVGLAFARGLGLALERPVIGVSTLEALALGAGQTRILSAIHVAGSLFVGAWDGRRVILEPCRIEIAPLLEMLQGEWSVTGPAAHLILAQRPDWVHIAQPLVDPVVLAQTAAFVDPATHRPNPLYLRGVDAKLPGGVILDPAPT